MQTAAKAERMRQRLFALLIGASFVVTSFPSRNEIMRFLRENKVERNVYDTEFACVCYSCDLQMAAAEQGIMAALVVLVFDDNKGHALVGFDTMDQGMIYIEPQADLLVRVEVGQLYESFECFRTGENCIVWSKDQGEILMMGTSWNMDTPLCKTRRCPFVHQ